MVVEHRHIKFPRREFERIFPNIRSGICCCVRLQERNGYMPPAKDPDSLNRLKIVYGAMPPSLTPDYKRAERYIGLLKVWELEACHLPCPSFVHETESTSFGVGVTIHTDVVVPGFKCVFRRRCVFAFYLAEVPGPNQGLL